MGVVEACNGSSFWRAKFSFGIIGIINSQSHWKPFRFHFNFDSTSRLYFVFSFLSSLFLNTMSFERWCGGREQRKIFHNESPVATALHESQKIIQPDMKFTLKNLQILGRFGHQKFSYWDLTKNNQNLLQEQEKRKQKTIEQMNLWEEVKFRFSFEYTSLQK